jgi:hypothetical protein
MNYTANIAYNLSDDDFEELANCLTARLTGTEVISFSKGRDGGKDGRRIGFSKNPSKWRASGSKFIIQAKHTTKADSACSDGVFHGNKESIINIEIKKVNSYIGKGELEYYILYTNRKYSGGMDTIIRKYMSVKTGLDINSIEIIGIETLNSMLNLVSNKDLVSQFNLNKNHIPFEFSEEDIKDVILSFKAQIPSISEEIKEKADDIKSNYENIGKPEKNKKNNLSETYFQEMILATSLKDFYKIDYFLELEKNSNLKDIYFDVVAELKEVILLKRDDFGGFEEIFKYIYDQIKYDPEYKSKKKFIRVLLHYMYYSCSIGIK